ncbi:MAG: DEAD/DEAH box helicase [Clostridia bacterium]|jgi:superfamily II DNA or RNA helicase
MKIVLKLDNDVTYVEGYLSPEIYEGFKKKLGYLPQDAIWKIKKQEKDIREAELSGKPVPDWKKNWDGRVSTVCYNYNHCRCGLKKDGMHFPTGLTSLAVSFFKERNYSVQIIDIRKKFEKTLNLSMSSNFEKRDYQTEVVNKTDKTTRGIIKVATGGGKSSIAASIIARRGVSPTIFYVPSIDLLTQSKNELEKFIIDYNGENIKVGQIGGGKMDIQDINVMTIQTAVQSLGGVWVKYDDECQNDEDIGWERDVKGKYQKEITKVIRDAKLIIADECQHWSSQTCQIISENSISALYRWALSATPKRDQEDDILIDACFGKTVANINASYLIKHKFLVPPVIRFFTIDNKFKTKKINYANIYKEAIVENIYRNRVIATAAENFLKEGRNILILCKQISHGKILEKMIEGSVFLHGEHSGKKRKEHLDKMRLGEPRVTISSVIFDEGIDVRALDTLILAGSGKSSTRALQRVGRILRPFTYPDGRVKKQALVLDFMDNCKYLQEHSKKRFRMYKTEPEFDVSIYKS